MHDRDEDAVMSHQHHFWCFVKGVGIPDLLCHPIATGVVGGSAHHKLSTAMVDDVENIQRLAPYVASQAKTFANA